MADCTEPTADDVEIGGGCGCCGGGDEPSWVNLTEDGGVQKKILREGDGDTPTDGTDVFCHYVGTLQSTGEKFDSSRDRGDPFNFPIGQGKVIKGWDIGIATMRAGEIAILRCTSEYAYGKDGTGSIPGGATLDFEVELLNWDPWKRVHAKDDLKKMILQKGEGQDWDNPKEDARVIVNYVGRLGEDESSTVFAEGKEVEIVVDDDERFPSGFHECLRDMTKGSKVLFELGPAWGYGLEGNSDLNVEGNATIYYEIELISYENPKELYQLSAEEHFSEAEARKTEGNTAFKAQIYPRAVKKYEKAIKILENNYDFNDEQKEEAKRNIAMIKCNLCLTYIKSKNYTECVNKAKDVLDYDANNIKALARRGQAYLELGDLDEAKDDLTKAFNLNKNNTFVKKLLKQVKTKIKQYKQRERQMYANMFG